jgi:CheY-like chemotaxis protein
MDAARLRLADLIEVLSEPTLLSDEKGRIQAANQSFYALAGYGALDLSRLSTDSVLPRPTPSPSPPAAAPAPDPSPCRFLVCDDGEQVPVEIDSTEVPIDDGFLLLHSISPVQSDRKKASTDVPAALPAARLASNPPLWTQLKSRGTVLVVEPRPALRASMLHVLTSVGYDTVGAEHAAGAESLIDEAGHYDRVIIETVLPDRSGHALRRLIEQRTSATHVLMVSGDGPSDDGGRDDGPPALLKPFGAEGLIQAIGQVGNAA